MKLTRNKRYIMKSIKKIYLLSALALTVATPMLHANDETDAKIHQAVEARLAKTPTNATDLATTLDILKTEILEIIKNSPDSVQYASLKTALEKLNSKQMLAMIIHLKTILNNVPGHTKALILTKVPTNLQSWLK